MNRRRFLGGSSLVLSTTIAGCTDAFDGSDDGGDEVGSDDDTGVDDGVGADDSIDDGATDDGAADDSGTTDEGAAEPASADASTIGEGEAPAWSEWIPADLLEEGAEPMVVHVDAERTTNWPAEPRTPIAVSEFVETNELDTFGTVDSALEVAGSGSARQGHFVCFGTFDPYAVEEAITGEYAGYQVLEEVAAISEDVLVLSEAYDRFVDASEGARERMVYADGYWDEGLRVVGDAAVSKFRMATGDDDVAWVGHAIDVDGDRVVQDTVGRFIDEEIATAVYEEDAHTLEDDPTVDADQHAAFLHLAYDVAVEDVLRAENVLVIRDSTLVDYHPHDR